jgi:hypothetical protein
LTRSGYFVGFDDASASSRSRLLVLGAGRHVNFALRVNRALEILDCPAEAVAELRQLRRPEHDDDDDQE